MTKSERPESPAERSDHRRPTDQAQDFQAKLDLERAANRQGPSHPAHGAHAQWRKDHGLDVEDEQPTT
jgi:hypothetical protein